uniref:Uncharacterized protein n=1 Tax=Candidozyma auris TaxID=498019 RepID=A0A0L0NXI1_CANAR
MRLAVHDTVEFGDVLVLVHGPFHEILILRKLLQLVGASWAIDMG